VLADDINTTGRSAEEKKKCFTVIKSPADTMELKERKKERKRKKRKNEKRGERGGGLNTLQLQETESKQLSSHILQLWNTNLTEYVDLHTWAH